MPGQFVFVDYNKYHFNDYIGMRYDGCFDIVMNVVRILLCLLRLHMDQCYPYPSAFITGATI